MDKINEAQQTILNTLVEMGCDKHYSKRAISVYTKYYGINYNITTLKEIMFRLQIKDSLKQTQNTFNYSKINAMLTTMHFSADYIHSSLIVYELSETFRNTKQYNLPIITEIIMRLRAKYKENGIIPKYPYYPYPTFDAQTFDIQPNECLNVLECDSFQRINYFLEAYEKWLKNQQEQKKRYHKFKNVKYDDKYCSFYDIMLSDNYQIENVLDDYHHLTWSHNHNFEDIYNELSIKCHDVNACTCLIRNYMERSLVNNRNSAYFGMSSKEINFEQIMDIIHCYCLHLFDSNLLFTHNEMNDINNDYKHAFDEKEEEKYMNGDTLKIQIMQDIINKKKEKQTISKFINNDKFITELQKNNDLDLIYHFGVKYNYYNKSDQFYVCAKYKSLKNELLNGLMTKSQFQVLYLRADNMKNKQHSKIYQAEYNEYGIAYLSSIKLQHLLSLMIYCNHQNIGKLVRKTYVKTDTKETNKEMCKMHSKYANLGKNLFEIVQLYGNKTKRGDIFYHSINEPMTFFASKICISCPLSTTNKIEVILSYKTNKKGMMIELKDENTYFEMKYFHCDWLSDFGGEKELFFNGNQQLIHKFVYNKIVDINSGTDYSKYLQSISVINRIFCAQIYQHIHELNPFVISMILNLFRNELNENIVTDINIPQYIKHLMHSYICCIRIIRINWYHIIKYYNFIKPLLCFNQFINFNVLFKLFQNATNILIDGGGTLILNGIIMDYIHSFLQCADRKKRNLKSIEIKHTNKSSLSFFLLLSLYEQKFSNIHCRININKKTDETDESFIIQCIPFHPAFGTEY